MATTLGIRVQMHGRRHDIDRAWRYFMGLRKAFAGAETVVLFYDGKRLGETDKLLPLAMNVERGLSAICPPHTG